MEIWQYKLLSIVSAFCRNYEYMNKIFNALNMNDNIQFVFIAQTQCVYCAVLTESSVYDIVECSTLKT